jgi:hypothetical protein
MPHLRGGGIPHPNLDLIKKVVLPLSPIETGDQPDYDGLHSCYLFPPFRTGRPPRLCRWSFG